MSEDAPRGMEFLYSLNRLNVATSRARCISLVLASPALIRPRAKSPRQMMLANAQGACGTLYEAGRQRQAAAGQVRYTGVPRGCSSSWWSWMRISRPSTSTLQSRKFPR